MKELNYEMKRKEKKMKNEEDINKMMKWNKEEKIWLKWKKRKMNDIERIEL